MEATGREKAAALLYPLPLQLTLTRHPISFRDTGSFSVGPPTTQASSDGPDIEGPSGAGLMVPKPWGQGERQLRFPWNDAHGRGSLPPEGGECEMLFQQPASPHPTFSNRADVGRET